MICDIQFLCLCICSFLLGSITLFQVCQQSETQAGCVRDAACPWEMGMALARVWSSPWDVALKNVQLLLCV